MPLVPSGKKVIKQVYRTRAITKSTKVCIRLTAVVFENKSWNFERRVLAKLCNVLALSVRIFGCHSFVKLIYLDQLNDEEECSELMENG